MRPLVYETDQGGTTVGGEGSTVPGEYVWVEEQYQTEKQVIVGYTTEEVTVTQSVQVGRARVTKLSARLRRRDRTRTEVGRVPFEA